MKLASIIVLTAMIAVATSIAIAQNQTSNRTRTFELAPMTSEENRAEHVKSEFESKSASERLRKGNDEDDAENGVMQPLEEDPDFAAASAIDIASAKGAQKGKRTRGKQTRRKPKKPPRPPPPRPKIVKRKPRTQGRPGASSSKWKQKFAGRFGKKGTPKPKVPPKRGYGYDRQGNRQYYHDDFNRGGEEFVDTQTGRKRPGVLSYAGGPAMSGVSGLIGGRSAKQQSEDEYYDDDGVFAPPPDTGPIDFDKYGLHPRKKKEKGIDLTSLAALVGVPVLIIGGGYLYMRSKKKRRGKTTSESESEAETEITRLQPKQKRKLKLRLSKLMRRRKQKQKKKNAPQTSMVSGITQTESMQTEADTTTTQTAATETTTAAVSTDLSTAPRRKAKKFPESKADSQVASDKEPTEAESQATSAVESAAPMKLSKKSPVSGKKKKSAASSKKSATGSKAKKSITKKKGRK